MILVYHQPQHGAPLHLRPLQHFLHGCLCTQQLASGNLNFDGTVQVEGDDGFRWVSSRTRDDTGDGACEVIWVEQLQILD